MIRTRSHSVKYVIVLSVCFLISSCAPQTKDIAIKTTLPAVANTPKLTPTIPLSIAPESPLTHPEIPATYALPSWIGDSNYSVFSMITDISDNSNELTFVNANTHEKFVIQVPTTNISSYFWTLDGKNLGFIESDFLTILLLDLKTGKVTRYSIPKNHTQCLDKYEKEKRPVLNYLYPRSSLPFGPSFFCLDPKLEFIPFLFNTEERQGKSFILVENELTGQKFELSDPNKNLANLDYEVSLSETRLAVLQGSVPDPDDRNPMGTRILVYDLPTRKMISSFEGQFCSLYWSPDGEKLLTTKADSTRCYSGELPVILYPESNRSYSIPVIDNAKNSMGSIHTSLYNWSSDSNFLYYFYDTSERGDICRHDLKSDQIFCLTSNFSELNNLGIEDYRFSPDGKFLTFSYGHSCQGCDFWGEPSSALIRIDGSDLLKLGKEVQGTPLQNFYRTYPYGTLVWRPVPTQ